MINHLSEDGLPSPSACDGSSSDWASVLCRDNIRDNRKHLYCLLARCILPTDHRKLSASVRRRLVPVFPGNLARGRCVQCPWGRSSTRFAHNANIGVVLCLSRARIELMKIRSPMSFLLRKYCTIENILTIVGDVLRIHLEHRIYLPRLLYSI